MELLNTKENPFIGYIDKFKSLNPEKELNPVHEIVKIYFEINNLDKMPKFFYIKRYAYPKMAREAKQLLEACGGNLEDALWSLDKMKYKANKGKFDWSIITCLKHKLQW